MYTSYIGRKFLAQWNERNGQRLTAREFFDRVQFPIFFAYDKHLMHVSNSPFFQKVPEEELKSGIPAAEIQLRKLHQKVKEKKPDASFFVGYAASNATEKTSGQVTDMLSRRMRQPGSVPTEASQEEVVMSPPIDEEDIYASWIGAALGTCVEGGFCWLMEQPEILWILYEGWSIYRKYLEQTPQLKGRQIETWNGRWLAHRLNGGDERSFDPEIDTTHLKKGEEASLATIPWARLLLSLCLKYPREIITVYTYKFGQSNTTLGFYNFYLPEVHRLYDLRNILFSETEKGILTDAEIKLIEPYYTFKNACKLGCIGLRAVEPRELRKYLFIKEDDKARKLNLDNREQHKQFLIFKLWICAMINKKELIDLAAQLADFLTDFEKTADERGKTTGARLTEEIRTAANLRTFIDGWSEVLKKMTEANKASDEHIHLIREAVHQVTLMPVDQFPLFSALLRFEYNAQKSLGARK